MPAKKTPLRKCVGCNEMRPKNTLARVVLSPEEELCVDMTGKKNGRGAYVCKSLDCFNKARKSKGFERAFKRKIPDELYSALESGFNANE